MPWVKFASPEAVLVRRSAKKKKKTDCIIRFNRPVDPEDVRAGSRVRTRKKNNNIIIFMYFFSLSFYSTAGCNGNNKTPERLWVKPWKTRDRNRRFRYDGKLMSSLFLIIVVFFLRCAKYPPWVHYTDGRRHTSIIVSRVENFSFKKAQHLQLIHFLCTSKHWKYVLKKYSTIFFFFYQFN